MRSLSVGRVVVMLALALLVAGQVAAQDKQVVIAGGWAPGMVFGGSADLGSDTVPAGVMFNAAFPVAPKMQIVGDMGWNGKSGINVLTLTGGVRYAVPTSDGAMASPFVEVLAGLGRGSDERDSANGFAFGFGGGVDIKTSGSVKVRIQANFWRLSFPGGNINALRFGIGVSTARKR